MCCRRCVHRTCFTYAYLLYSKRPCVWLIVYSHTFPCLAVIAMTAMGVFS